MRKSLFPQTPHALVPAAVLLVSLCGTVVSQEVIGLPGETLLHNLVDIASKGGNYLLNVGPTCLGEIPQPSLERLQAIGKWMKVNGESIYATTAGPFRRLPWGRCTKRLNDGGATLYLHVFDWPKDGKLGDVRLGQGTHELSIKPVRGQWQAINVRSVVLKPVD